MSQQFDSVDRKAARLVENQRVAWVHGVAVVNGDRDSYLVRRLAGGGWSCTCPWGINRPDAKACSHVLAAALTAPIGGVRPAAAAAEVAKPAEKRPTPPARVPHTSDLCPECHAVLMSAWLGFVAEANAVMNLAAALRISQQGAAAEGAGRGNPDDWQLLASRQDERKASLGGTQSSRIPDDAPGQYPNNALCLMLIDWVDEHWLNISRPKLRLKTPHAWLGIPQGIAVAAWPYEKTELIVTQRRDFGLWQTLALHLALTIIGANRFAYCSACGDAYHPQNGARTGERRYCPACGKKAAQRDASRDYRRRLAEGRQSQ